MADRSKEIEYKLSEYPNVKYNMLEHTIFNDFLSKATDEQLEFCEDFFNDEILVLTNSSKSGSAKTYTSIVCAYADYLNKGKEIMFIMSPAEENSIGHRPGDVNQKALDYFSPLHDALLELNLNPMQVVKTMLELDPNVEKEKIENAFVTQTLHTFLRGSNVSNRTVILSEAQNFTRGELKKTLTRMHDSCTVIIEGQPEQSDIKRNKSGFEPYIELFRQHDFAKHHKFTHNFRGVISTVSDSLTW